MATMSSLVLEIQKDIIKNIEPITVILRKALVLSTKLELTDFEYWINCELKGYKTSDKLPKYRILAGEMKALNPYHGLIPIDFEDEEEAEIFSRKNIFDPITQLEKVANTIKGNGYIEAKIPNSIKLQLLNITNGCEAKFLLNTAQFLSLIEEVKTRILEWTIALEKKGILGDNMSFSDEEKEKAIESQEINISNFQGVIGDISNSDVTINAELNVVTNNIEALSTLLSEKMGLSEDDIEDMKEAIQTDIQPTESGKFGPKVSAWIGKIVGKAANGALKVGINVATNLITNAISAFYGF